MDQAAYILRGNAGTSGLAGTARMAAAMLAEQGIPRLVVGGLAVYPAVPAHCLEPRDALLAGK